MPSKNKKTKTANPATPPMPPPPPKEVIKVPDDFANLLVDFTKDLTITFPEYSHLWMKWTTLARTPEVGTTESVRDLSDKDIARTPEVGTTESVRDLSGDGLSSKDIDIPDISRTSEIGTTGSVRCLSGDELSSQDKEIRHVFEYCITIFPERFFDILYQNDDIFKPNSGANTFFLPGVDFKLLYNCENVSATTHQTIWKYLQVLLLSVIGSVKDKTNFGDTMNIFDGVSEEELQDKLKETIDSLGSFFKASGLDSDDDDEVPEGVPLNTSAENNNGVPDFDAFSKSFNFENMSGSAEDLHGHLKNLFDGKIGSLAKEMAEEIAKDLGSLLGEDGEDITSTQDFLKKMIRNPKKLMELMKSVSSKLNSKMKSGDISQEELMKEASEWMGKMKGMGGADQFSEVFKNLAKNMGGLGKNSSLDMNAMNRMMNKNARKERMLEKLEKLKEAKLQATETPNNYIFRMEGEETQEKSYVKPDVDQIMKDFNLVNDIISASTQSKPANKKKKNKNNK